MDDNIEVPDARLKIACVKNHIACAYHHQHAPSKRATHIGIAGRIDRLILKYGVLVLKEELPEERNSNFWAFAVGAAGYAALLMVA